MASQLIRHHAPDRSRTEDRWAYETLLAKFARDLGGRFPRFLASTNGANVLSSVSARDRRRIGGDPRQDRDDQFDGPADRAGAGFGDERLSFTYFRTSSVERKTNS